MERHFRLRCRLGGALLLLLGALLPIAAWAAMAAAPVPPGMARIWFYRDYQPSVSLNMAPIQLNGRIVGYAQPDGSAFYRDVPPGHYHIAAVSEGMDVNQTRDVDLAAGQQAYVKIEVSGSWDSSGDMSSYKRDTYYVVLIPPQVARAELAHHRLGGG